MARVSFVDREIRLRRDSGAGPCNFFLALEHLWRSDNRYPHICYTTSNTHRPRSTKVQSLALCLLSLVRFLFKGLTDL